MLQARGHSAVRGDVNVALGGVQEETVTVYQVLAERQAHCETFPSLSCLLTCRGSWAHPVWGQSGERRIQPRAGLGAKRSCLRKMT